MRFTKRICVMISALTVLAFFAPATPADDQKTIFKARSEFVLVPVVVADKSGSPVTGLTKDDFEIDDNGKPQPVAACDEIKTSSGLLTREPSQRGVFTNGLSGSAGPKRLTIFALDMVNTPFMSQAYAREQLLKYLATKVSDQEPIALVAISIGGIRVLHDFTSDPAVLVAALKKVTGLNPAFNGQSPGELLGDQVAGDQVAGASEELSSFLNTSAQFGTFQDLVSAQTASATLEAFQHVAEAFAGVPGRKSLIWATSGFPFSLDPTNGFILSPHVFSQGDIRYTATTMGSTGALPQLPSTTSVTGSNQLSALEPLYQRTMQMLNDASISVYPVDARGLVVFFPGADSSRISGINTFNQAVFEATRQTMVNIADMTGGRAFYNRNDLDVAFQKAADDSASYYMLGYYLEKNAKPGWHRLKVKLKKGPGEVRARSGFFVSSPSKQTDIQKMDIRLALASPLPYTGLPIAVRWIGAEPAAAKKKVHFEVYLSPESKVLDVNNQNHVSLEFVAAVRTGRGEPVDQLSEHVEANMKPENVALFEKQGLNYSNVLVVPPGEYTARFIVRDNITGRMGSLTAPVRVAP